MNLEGSQPAPISIPSFSPSQFNFLESVEAAHSSHSTNDKISTLLGITRSPIRMDSQAKYGALARGDGGAYMRMPTGVGYREKIWVGSKIFEKLYLTDLAERITPLVHYWLKKLVVWSVTHAACHWILD